MATRRLTIQVFDIVPRTAEIPTPNYPSWLFSILDRTNSISERFMTRRLFLSRRLVIL